MPLKLLKRSSNHYNVVSKSTFVISVTLLDNGVMECTMDVDSTGTDCLHNISQRLALHQPEFFGLRYISRGVPPRERWIELELPLKKQLDKYAEEPRLSLGVMFYVSDVNLLKDEMTRYHYFLQLKSDVIDGKLNCSIDQSISLAAYSLQAEFGDYDPERHTVEYLRDFAILPKDLTVETCQEINVDAIFDAVARQYGSLLGFPPPLAEIYYIMVAQQLDGYGQECYPAKDDSGNDVLICASVNGLVIRRRDWTHVAAFRWRDIKSLMGHKRTFLLESAQSHRTMQFHFSDSEIVKYVRKICALQSTFHIGSSSNLELQNYEYESQRQGLNFHGSSLTGSYESPENLNSNANLRATPDLIKPVGIGSLNSLNNNFANQYGSKPSRSNLQLFENNSLPSTQYRHQMLQQQQIQQGFHRSLQDLSGSNGLSLLPGVLPGTPNPGGDRPHSSHHLSDSRNCAIQPLLPSYRPAPDYDTAVQLKYSRQQEHGNLNEEPIYQNEIVSQMHSIDLRERADSQEQRKLTPSEIPGENSGQEGTDTNLSYFYKPPPPYPGTFEIGSFDHHSHRHLKTSSSNSISGTSRRSSYNAHAEALKQISSDLYNRSIEAVSSHYAGDGGGGNNCTSQGHNPVNPSSQGHNPVTSSSQGAMRVNGILEKPKSGTTSILDELTKSMTPERVTQVFSPEGNQVQTNSQEHGTTNSKPFSDYPNFRKAIDVNIMKEFQSIQKAKVSPNFAIGMKRENAKRNRTPNVLPYDDNSIRLSPSKHNADGYINASPISTKIGDRIWKYTVGQIPLCGNGPCALWQMIWETDSRIIVTLERDSSAPFYPADVENSANLSIGDFQIIACKNKRSTPKTSIARELIMSHVSKKKQRRIWLLPYEDEWKHDVPVDTEHFLCFLEEVNSVQRKVSEGLTPLTVLCGTGAGRSGVFVLSDLLLHAADAGHKIRCDSLLSELRTERMLLVTHPTQYSFVLDTLAKYLAQSRLI